MESDDCIEHHLSSSFPLLLLPSWERRKTKRCRCKESWGGVGTPLNFHEIGCWVQEWSILRDLTRKLCPRAWDIMQSGEFRENMRSVVTTITSSHNVLCARIWVVVFGSEEVKHKSSTSPHFHPQRVYISQFSKTSFGILSAVPFCERSQLLGVFFGGCHHFEPGFGLLGNIFRCEEWINLLSTIKADAVHSNRNTQKWNGMEG